jgi:hypothetical protein
MEAMEARLLEKLSKLDGMVDRFTALDAKLDQQTARFDQVQIKVDLTMDKLGRLEEEQMVMARALQNKGPELGPRLHPTMAPATPLASACIMGSRSASAPNL